VIISTSLDSFVTISIGFDSFVIISIGFDSFVIISTAFDSFVIILAGLDSSFGAVSTSRFLTGDNWRLLADISDGFTSFFILASS